MCIIFLSFGPLRINGKDSQQTDEKHFRFSNIMLLYCNTPAFSLGDQSFMAPRVTGGSGFSFFFFLSR
jgi:hypothetical protein